MPPKKAAPAASGAMPTKASFFMSRRVLEEVPKSGGKLPIGRGGSSSFPESRLGSAPKRPALLYDKSTGDAYAEVVGDAAVCLTTGVELFRFRFCRGRDDDEDGGGGGGASGRFVSSGRTFDFSPPSGRRHPGERFVDVLNLVKAGILSEADVASRRAFSDAELRGFMARLDAYLAENSEVSEA